MRVVYQLSACPRRTANRRASPHNIGEHEISGTTKRDCAFELYVKGPSKNRANRNLSLELDEEENEKIKTRLFVYLF